MSARRILAAVAGAVLCSSVALSSTLYSNFNTTYAADPGDLGDFYSSGPYVSGDSSFPGQVNHVANAFTLPAGPGITGYQLNSAQLGMSLYDGTNEVKVSVVTDEAGLPDTDHVVGSVSVAGQMSNYATPGRIEANFAANPLQLTPGQKYWLVAAPGQSDTAAIWHSNYAPQLVWNDTWGSFDVVDNWLTGETAWFDGTTWQKSVHTDPMGSVPPNDALNAFSLEGAAMSVPEPALIGIAAGPVLCGLWLRRRTA